MKYLSLLIACCAALALPASAAAIKCAPPGVSGVSQYFETVPGSSCSRPSTGSGSGSGSGGGGSLSSRTSTQLSKAGAVGQAVKRLVATSGTGSNSSGSNSGTSNPTTPGGSPKVGTAISGSGRNPLSALLHPILSGASSGGVGVLLPIFLGVALVLALAGTLVRRRWGSSRPQT